MTMTMTRVMLVAPHKIAESVITLLHDHHLSPPPDRTIVVLASRRDNKILPGIYPVDLGDRNDLDLLALYQHHGIDTQNFEVLHDADVLQQFEKDHGVFRWGYWIMQQMIKLLMLDRFSTESTVMLLHDCDTFHIQPVNFLHHDSIRMLSLPASRADPHYLRYVDLFIDQAPSMPDISFITEIMPVLSQDWRDLVHHVELKHQRPWLDVILDQLAQDYAARISLWFSEYELLARWCLRQHPAIVLHPTHRMLFDHECARHVRDGRLPQDFPLERVPPGVSDAVAFKIYDADLLLDTAHISATLDFLEYWKTRITCDPRPLS